MICPLCYEWKVDVIAAHGVWMCLDCVVALDPALEGGA